MFLKSLEQHLKTRAERRFHARVSDERVLEEGYRSGPIVPNTDYFDIRVAEMFLSYRSEYGRSFVPLLVTAIEFIYGGKSRSLPFFVRSSDLLRDVDAYVKGKDVTFRNTRIVGPVPYSGNDVAVFVGLYRAQVGDFARKLLEVLGKVVSVFDVTKLSAYFDMAGDVADGLYSLLNFEEIEYRTGDRYVFQDSGTNLFEAGYYVYVNCKDTEIKADELWVQGSELKIGSAPGSLRSFNDYDYCLLQISKADRREDYTSLPFHEKWKQARDRISKGDDALAHTLFVECCQQIADSPDLTPSNAEALIQAYQANYAKDVEFYGKLRVPPQTHVAMIYRAAEEGTLLEPQQSIMRTAQVAEKAGAKQQALQSLVALSENWNRLPHLQSVGAELTDQLLKEQLATIGSFTKKSAPDAKGLAEALAVASVTAS